MGRGCRCMPEGLGQQAGGVVSELADQVLVESVGVTVKGFTDVGRRCAVGRGVLQRREQVLGGFGVRAELEFVFQTGNGRFGVALLLKNKRQIVVQFGYLRLQTDGVPVVPDGVFQFSRGFQGDALGA